MSSNTAFKFSNNIIALRSGGSVIDYGSIQVTHNDEQIAPIDIDGFMEISGNHLYLECKQPGEQLSPGQFRALRDLSRNPRTIVLVVKLSGRSDPHHPHVKCFDPVGYYQLYDGAADVYKPTNITEFQQLLKEWHDRSRANPYNRNVISDTGPLAVFPGEYVCDVNN